MSPMAQPALSRAVSDGCIPVYHSSDLKVTHKPAFNLDGISPAEDRLWYGNVAFEIAGQHWVIDKFVNYGGEGQTYLVTRSSDGKRCVAKFGSQSDSREIKVLKTLPRRLVRHPNFVTYEMIVLDVQGALAPANHIIFMEHVPNGEVFEMLSEPSASHTPVSEGTMRRFLRDVIRGMAECYRFGVTHRDLKPENLLINEQGSIVIIDLGHAKRGEHGGLAPLLNRSPVGDGTPPPPPVYLRTSSANPYGTVGFNAPEVNLGIKYDCELADIWSLGVIAFYLHAKLPAFSVAGGAACWGDITGTDNDPFWREIKSSGWYPSFPSGLIQFINVLWCTDPAKRPSFNMLKRATTGDSDTLAQFPGLQWLAQPVNDSAAFLRELRNSCPEKIFKAC